MDASEQMQTATRTANEMKAPVNQFSHRRRPPTSDDRWVVRANVDTLYSVAWLDLKAEPLVLSVPDMGSRYYLMQMMDAWTNTFAGPSPRTTGTGPGTFAITGPDWQGSLPEGMTELRSPTNLVWILGRIQAGDGHGRVGVLRQAVRVDGRRPSCRRRPA